MNKLNHKEIMNWIVTNERQILSYFQSSDLFHAIVSDLDRNELKELSQKLEKGTGLYDVVYRRIKSKYENPLIRAEYKDLIYWYRNDTKGKVAEARSVLKQRYDYLSNKERHEIIDAFINKGKPSDRKWVYKKLNEEWDENYKDTVKELWSSFHEKDCELLIINHFDFSYIKDHVDELDDKESHRRLTYRLAESLSWTIDRNEMSADDFLRLICYSKRPVNSAEVRRALFEIISQIPNSEKRFKKVGMDVDPLPFNASTYSFEEVHKAIWYIGKAGFTDVVSDYAAWDYKLFNRTKMESRYNNYISWIITLSKEERDKVDESLRDRLYREFYASVAFHFPIEYKEFLVIQNNIKRLLFSDNLSIESETLDKLFYDKAMAVKREEMDSTPENKERELTHAESKDLVNKLRKDNHAIEQLIDKLGLDLVPERNKKNDKRT